jgi:hypothetical protein
MHDFSPKIGFLRNLLAVEFSLTFLEGDFWGQNRASKAKNWAE